jgi:hypothetical protein
MVSLIRCPMKTVSIVFGTVATLIIKTERLLRMSISKVV